MLDAFFFLTQDVVMELFAFLDMEDIHRKLEISFEWVIQFLKYLVLHWIISRFVLTFLQIVFLEKTCV